MAPEKKMSLLMEINAKGDKALAEINRLHSKFTTIGTGVGAVLGVGGSILDTLVKPLEWGAKAAGGLGAAFVALAGKSLMARSSMEQLELRMGDMKTLQETISAGGATFFSNDELVSARMGLRAIGMDGKAAFQQLMDTAAGSGRSLEEVTSLVAMLSARGLKHFGIGIKREGDEVVISYRDKMNQLQQITAATEEEARTKLLGILGGRYAGKANLLGGNTAKGAFTGITKAFDEAQVQFGKGMEPAAIAFMQAISARMGEFVSSGRAGEIGAAVGDAMMEVANVVDGFIQNPEKLRKFFGDLMTFAVYSFGVYLSTLTSVAADFGAEIGKGFAKWIDKAAPYLKYALGASAGGYAFNQALTTPERPVSEVAAGIKDKILAAQTELRNGWNGIVGQDLPQGEALEDVKYRGPGQIGKPSHMAAPRGLYHVGEQLPGEKGVVIYVGGDVNVGASSVRQMTDSLTRSAATAQAAPAGT